MAWKGESRRHSLARKGIKTANRTQNYSMSSRGYLDVNDKTFNNSLQAISKVIKRELEKKVAERKYTEEELTEELNDMFVEEYSGWVEAMVEDEVDEYMRSQETDWKDELLDIFDKQSEQMVKVETRQGRDVWINMQMVNDVDNMEDMRGRAFWGNKNIDSELGWYFDFDDIKRIIEIRER